MNRLMQSDDDPADADDGRFPCWTTVLRQDHREHLKSPEIRRGRAQSELSLSCER